MTVRAQLNHLGLYTPDIARIQRFYENAMGLVVTERGRVPRLGDVEIVFMSANPASHHQVALIGRPGQSGPSCVNQIAFKLQSLAELRIVHGRLLEEATGALQPIDHGNAWSVYGVDPDGNGVEVYVDTPWHVSQPHSVPLDFSLTDEEIARRTHERIRTHPSYRPLAQWAREFASRL